MSLKTIVTTAMLASLLFGGLCQADSALAVSQDARAAYRLCQDGTMINPGEKCPEKSAKASR